MSFEQGVTFCCEESALPPCLESPEATQGQERGARRGGKWIVLKRRAGLASADPDEDGKQEWDGTRSCPRHCRRGVVGHGSGEQEGDIRAEGGGCSCRDGDLIGSLVSIHM